jgi:ABC-type nitrate/sulfonate/bicarbonate transport system permease component
VNRRPPGLVTFVCSLCVLVLLGIGWQAAIWIGRIPAYSVPSPYQTLCAIAADFPMIAGRCLETAEGAALGLAAAVLIAGALAIVVTRWPALARPVTGYALVIRTLPIVGVAPLVTLVAGRGLLTSVVCVVIITVFTLLVAATEALQAMPPPVTDLAALYGASLYRRVRWAWLPSAVAGLVTGLRICGPLAVLAAVLAEWLSGRSGVGSLMTYAQANRETTLLWAATVAAAVLGLIAYGLPGLAAAAARRRGFSVEVETT